MIECKLHFSKRQTAFGGLCVLGRYLSEGGILEPLSDVQIAQKTLEHSPAQKLTDGAKSLPRALTLQPREEHEAIQFARKRQKTEEFASLYSNRTGIEGTFSQGVRAFGLRKARYRGLEKTHLQEVATAASINVGRITTWLNGVPTAATRRSRFMALAQAS